MFKKRAVADRRSTVERLCTQLAEASEHEKPDRYRDLIAQARPLTVSIETLEDAQLLAHVAEFDRTLGDSAAARREYERLAHSVGQLLGPEHPDALNARAKYTNLVLAQGDTSEARELLEQLVDAQKKVLGPNHEATIRSMVNLGAALGVLGDRRAIAVQSEAMLAAAQALGQTHPLTETAVSHFEASTSAATRSESPAARTEPGVGISMDVRLDGPGGANLQITVVNHGSSTVRITGLGISFELDSRIAANPKRMDPVTMLDGSSGTSIEEDGRIQILYDVNRKPLLCHVSTPISAWVKYEGPGGLAALRSRPDPTFERLLEVGWKPPTGTDPKLLAKSLM